MNYYPFHLGDYAAHTAHLEPMEDLAYRRMLDLYYRTEKPLPTDWAEVARLIRMKDYPAEVQAVLNEFFLLTEEGWRHARCDEELAKMQDKQAKARASAKASVNARATNAQRTLNERSPDVELPTPTPITTEPKGSDAGAAVAEVESEKAALWRESVVVLKAGGCPESLCRSFMGKLVKDYGEAVVREAVTAGISAQPADAREYLKATCQRLKGERREPITVQSSAADETAEYLAKRAAQPVANPSPEVLARLKAVRAA